VTDPSGTPGEGAGTTDTSRDGGPKDSSNPIVEKDMAYSPASNSEIEELQETDVDDSAATEDVPDGAVEVLPGTGGPDDYGDVEPDQAEQAAAEFAESQGTEMSASEREQ
jgi:hypothetical protein